MFDSIHDLQMLALRNTKIKWLLCIMFVSGVTFLLFRLTNNLHSELKYIPLDVAVLPLVIKNKGYTKDSTTRKIRILSLNSLPIIPGERWSGKDVLNGQCEFIDNRMEEYNTSDVVIFKQNMFKEPLPAHRPHGQLWVYYAWESKGHATEKNYLENVAAANHFNYTMTYSRFSDFAFPYGECKQITERPADVNMEINNIIGQKTGLVAWMVSNCVTIGLRENYVRDLEKRIHVDVFGGCGNKDCGSHSNCTGILAGYKFYLAFENSLCGEYVTEKLWRSYMFGMVPIVYGGLNAYKAILPVNSYIDIADFSSPKILADYLLKVSNNDTLYRSYFSWKHKYACGALSRTDKFETICRFLVTAKPHTIDLNTVWDHPATKCEDSKQYLSKLGVTDLKSNPFNKEDVPEHLS